MSFLSDSQSTQEKQKELLILSTNLPVFKIMSQPTSILQASPRRVCRCLVVLQIHRLHLQVSFRDPGFCLGCNSAGHREEAIAFWVDSTRPFLVDRVLGRHVTGASHWSVVPESPQKASGETPTTQCVRSYHGRMEESSDTWDTYVQFWSLVLRPRFIDRDILLV